MMQYSPLYGVGCTAFCQCAPLRTNTDGSVDYYWVRQPCAPGTLWSQSLLTCDHAANVQCIGMNFAYVIVYKKTFICFKTSFIHYKSNTSYFGSELDNLDENLI